MGAEAFCQPVAGRNQHQLEEWRGRDHRPANPRGCRQVLVHDSGRNDHLTISPVIATIQRPTKTKRVSDAFRQNGMF